MKTQEIKNTLLAMAFAICSTLLFQACNGNQGNTAENTDNTTDMQQERSDGGTAEMENTDMVPSGTYTGIAQQVDPEENEVYVRTDNNKTIELYFDEQTELTQNGDSVSFDALAQGQRLEVTVEKNGEQLEPVSVNILDAKTAR